MDKEEKSTAKLTAKKEKAHEKVAQLQQQLSEINFSEEEFNQLDQEQTELERAATELKDKVETLTAQIETRLRFRYSDPVRGFDRSKVKGLFAKLVDVKNKEHATALEIAAGGRLYQVVVDEAITGKALLKNGKLERRVTIIPLDKIQPRRVTGANTEKARQIAGTMDSTASPAIDLLNFDEEVRNAVEYVFGSTLIVDGMKAANQVCDATKTRTVTLDGDVYDPSGTISGGSKNNLGTTLSRLTDLSEASRMLGEKQARLDAVISKLSPMKNAVTQFEKTNAKLELASAELENVEKHLSQTKFGMLSEKYEAMSKEIDEANSEYKAMEKEKDEKWALYHELQEKEEQLTQLREERLSQIDQAVKDAKKDAAKKTKNAREVRFDRAYVSKSNHHLILTFICSGRIQISGTKNGIG